MSNIRINQMKNDPRSCERNLCNLRKKTRKPEKIQDFNREFEPVTSRYRCDVLTNYAMKPLMLWSIMCSYVSVKEMNVIDVYEINHIRTAEMKSNKE